MGLLLSEIPATERVIVIEDAPELRPRCVHAVGLVTCPPNAEAAGEITIRDLVRQSLRMRPDRIVVGEVRGVELIDVLARNAPQSRLLHGDIVATQATVGFSGSGGAARHAHGDDSSNVALIVRPGATFSFTGCCVSIP